MSPMSMRVVGNAVHDRFRIRDDHVRLHFGVRGLELAENLRQHELGDRRAGAKEKRRR